MRRMIAAGLALVLLSGCGAPAAPPAGDPTAAAEVLAQVNAHNDADVTYVRDMIGHHAQGVELADLVPARTATPAVRDVAALIDRQQGVEIDQLRGQLRSWNLEPAGSTMSAGMAGMASPDTLARLRDTRGAAFDRLWLQAMITHHEGAVAMARTELDAGVQRGARNSAQNVIAVQQAQIDTMNGLLRAP
ncbi:uncharacterized protein (DUF305 family) [Pseudonocardia sediminis]|uniref:Uncharacterized protein (DUF305 family) n=1 Tax=Pseudonocardia sediminis TaxID=1397368 RepID=A0A4Q7UWJ2_PSEST|nr:DUF305 domain-containing protein [Pseudonocardia sediminis]RZT85358.1 uncharacterized protein (DUF305 family) [Pseudonocardia sediminis]